MCLLILALNQSPQYPLVVIANRDEQHQRPSAAADYWADQPQVIGGRDLVRGGTWLAFDHRGRFGAVTNFRDGNLTEHPRSRGDLVAAYLRSQQTADSFCNAIEQHHNKYAGFNLVVGEIGKTFRYQSNRGPGQALTQGVFGISNGELDSDWPKVTQGKAQLQQWLASQHEPDVLFDILADRGLSGGASDDAEADAASAIFLVNSIYGTRASTCILVDTNGHVIFQERRFDSQGQNVGSSAFEFPLRS